MKYRRTAMLMQIRTALTYIIVAAGWLGLGIICASVFIFTEKEFWANVSWVFGK